MGAGRVFSLAMAAFLLLGPPRGEAQNPPPPPVQVANPLPKRIVQWDEYTGRFEAVQRVEVRPRVSGFLEQIHFTDGALVQKGDKLFTIDQRPYQIALDSAKAALLRAQASVARTAADLARAQQLVRTAHVTMRDYDQRKADFDSARADELSAEASMRSAQLNLEWTDVTAPVAGRISDRRVDVGNLVSDANGGTLLTTIVSLDPIYFTFEGSEADYLRYVRMSRQGQRPSSRDAANPVQVKLADENAWLHNGHMNFVDNEMSARSSTIRGRAIFDNKDFFFLPGTFGHLRLYGGEADVLLVPDAAIASDQAQKVVMVVGADNVVAPRPVVLGGMAYGLRVITSGLSAGDKVIVGGLANPFVRPGATVSPQPGQITAIPDPSETVAPAPVASAADPK
jgi:multidrug efflux system membrane fusion protein